MKTAIYIRVSTEEQAKEGYSISAQLKKLKSFCISQNWEVVGVYADEGVSAKDTNRPELQRMIKDIKSGKINVVLVYRLDRLTRSVFDLYKLLELFEKYGCKFKSATEVYDTTTAIGRMFITIVAALAQWERENMGERIAMGFEEKVRQGKCPLTFAPIGFDLDKEKHKLVINPVEAIVVRTLYDKYIEGYGSNRVAIYMNKNKLLTKNGGPWSGDTVLKVLKNPANAGGIRWKGKIYWNMHEPIVPREKWELAQKLMKKRKIIPGPSVSSPHIFSGLIRCDSCGQHLTGETSSYTNRKGIRCVRFYYRCGNLKNGRCNTKIKSWSQNRIEKAFVEFLQKIEFDESVVKKVAKKGFSKEEENQLSADDEKKLRKRMNELEEIKKKWQYAWVEGMITDSDFKKRMEETNAEIEAIEKVLKENENIQQDEEKEISESEIIDALLEIKKNWYEMNPLEKKNLLREIIKEIKIKKVGKIDVEIVDIIFV